MHLQCSKYVILPRFCFFPCWADVSMSRTVSTRGHSKAIWSVLSTSAFAMMGAPCTTEKCNKCVLKLKQRQGQYRLVRVLK
jgi:hypothetical protein